jgi:hypothetical protein
MQDDDLNIKTRRNDEIYHFHLVQRIKEPSGAKEENRCQNEKKGCLKKGGPGQGQHN